MFAGQVRERLFPFLTSSNCDADCSTFLVEYLLRRVKQGLDGSGLGIAHAVVTASIPTLPPRSRLIQDVRDLTQLVLDAAYFCPVNGECNVATLVCFSIARCGSRVWFAGPEQCEYVNTMLQCLPSSASEKAQQDPVLMGKLARADALDRHLSAAEVTF